MSTRKTPILLRKAPLSGKINVLTNYRWINSGEILQAGMNGKHDVTADFDALMLEALLDPDSPNIVGILDGVADLEEITSQEASEVRAFRERLKAIIERHNTTGHGSKE